MTATHARPRISVFPKCYFDELYRGTRDYLGWLRQAAISCARRSSFCERYVVKLP